MTATGTSNPLDPDTEFRRLQVENHQQAERIAELENALSEMYTFFQPYAWGSADNRSDALSNAASALGLTQEKQG